MRGLASPNGTDAVLVHDAMPMANEWYANCHPSFAERSQSLCWFLRYAMPSIPHL